MVNVESMLRGFQETMGSVIRIYQSRRMKMWWAINVESEGSGGYFINKMSLLKQEEDDHFGENKAKVIRRVCKISDLRAAHGWYKET